jgi:hypothetical protein
MGTAGNADVQGNYELAVEKYYWTDDTASDVT